MHCMDGFYCRFRQSCHLENYASDEADIEQISASILHYIPGFGSAQEEIILHNPRLVR